MINLLPTEIKEDHRYGRKNVVIISWLATVIFGVVILFLVAIVGRLTIDAAKDQELTQKNAIQKELEDADYASIEKAYGDYIGDLGSVGKLYQEQILYSRLLRKLGTLLPAGASLTNISITDEDKALSLNFNNDRDLLGPTIQLNLTNQGEETAKRISQLFPYEVVKFSDDSDGIAVNAESRELSFYTNITNGSDIESMKSALSNGGDFARLLVKNLLTNNGYYGDEAPAKILSETTNTNSKFVDYQIAANSKVDAEKVAALLLNSPTSFIETYIFIDPSTYRGNGCKEKSNGQERCNVSCNSIENCGIEDLVCTALSDKGCRWVVRAYYDEVLSAGKIEPAENSVKQSCIASSRSCTHKISLTYNQLFDKVDIIRVATCSIDSSSDQLSCPVELRAEFSKDAKFYLISSGSK